MCSRCISLPPERRAAHHQHEDGQTHVPRWPRGKQNFPLEWEGGGGSLLFSFTLSKQEKLPPCNFTSLIPLHKKMLAKKCLKLIKLPVSDSKKTIWYYQIVFFESLICKHTRKIVVMKWFIKCGRKGAYFRRPTLKPLRLVFKETVHEFVKTSQESLDT